MEQSKPVNFLIVCLLAMGRSRSRSVREFPAAFRKHAELAGILSHERKTGQELLMAFDVKGDSNADTWKFCDFANQAPLQMSFPGKDFNGKVSTWIYFAPSSPLCKAWGREGDGGADKWRYRNLTKRVGTNFDGSVSNPWAE